MDDGNVLFYRYDLIVGKEDFLPRQVTRWWAPGDSLAEIVVCPGRAVPYGCDLTTWTVFGYGDPVVIEPPAVFTERTLP